MIKGRVQRGSVWQHDQRPLRRGDAWTIRAAQHAAHEPQAAQDGCEWDPMENHNFT